MKGDLERWESLHDPGQYSLRLLPLGPDRIGERHVRRLSRALIWRFMTKLASGFIAP